jgi:hypothetical protein
MVLPVKILARLAKSLVNLYLSEEAYRPLQLRW